MEVVVFYMRPGWRFPSALVPILLLSSTTASHAQVTGGKLTVNPHSSAQPSSGKLAGTWLLVGQTYVSGLALPPTANLNINDIRVTFTGDNGGTSLVDQPLRYGQNGHIEISCRGTVRANYTIARIAGKVVLHETQVVDTAGQNCGRMAGSSSTDALGGYRIVEITGDSMQLLNGLATEDSPSKAPDMLISTYRRVAP